MQDTFPLRDSFGRPVDYLRVSLTDRCSLRCVYCMPAHGMSFFSDDALLSNEELLTVVQAAAAVGFRKIRLTGGEPTLRPGLVGLVAAMKRLDGIEEIALTTNGLHLAELATPLRRAGLDRVNISLDSLDRETFAQITRGGKLADVLKGLEAATAAGLLPIKVNTVIVPGLNDTEILHFASLTTHYAWEIRFVEMMPFPQATTLAAHGFMHSRDIQKRIEEAFGALHLLPCDAQEPARRYRIAGAPGTVGFISSVTQSFCAACNRIRLTADGRLRLCLLSDDEIDVQAALRRGAGVQEIEQLFREAAQMKPWGHRLAEGIRPTRRGMSQLGG